MSYQIAPAAQAILDQATALWPNRNRASDGTLGDQAHAARASDHNPGHNGLVHAADLTHDPAHGVDCNTLAEHIKNDPRVKYVIWNRRIWNPSISRTWRPYTGSNPHDHHMHVSVTDAGENDTTPWFTPTQPTGGFGTMDDTKILTEFANVTKRTGAQLEALGDELKAQAKRHNEAARDRDVKLLAVLERIATKLDA